MKKLSLYLFIIFTAILLNSCGKDSSLITPDTSIYSLGVLEYKSDVAGSVHSTYKGPKQGKIVVSFTGETDMTTSAFNVKFVASNDTVPGPNTIKIYEETNPANFNKQQTVYVDVSEFDPLGMIFTIQMTSNQGTERYIRVRDLRIKPEV